MIKIIIGISLTCVLLVSCKKEKTTTTSTTPTPSVIQNSPYTVSNATVFSGVFSTGKNTHSMTYNYSRSIAYFNITPSSTADSINIIPVAGVILNNEFLNIDTTYKTYLKEVFSPGIFGTETWQIQGANGIPSFNYTDTYIPDCTNFNTIPDSFSISSGFTLALNINNITTSGMELMIGDNSGHYTIAKPLQNGNNVISFSPTELYNFVPTNIGDIIITLEHKHVLNFYSKDFLFLKKRNYDKVVKIKS